MKAICIDAKQRGLPTQLIEGNTYDVEDDRLFPWDTYFIPSLRQSYDKDRFIPLSEVDETEETELVNQKELQA